MLILLIRILVTAAILALFFLSPDINKWEKEELRQSGIVYSLDNRPLYWHGPPYRDYQTIGNIPSLLISAVRTTEDHRFFFHNGVDWISMGRAIRHLLRTGRKDIGASTITMQLARNAFLSSQKTYWRKIKELFLAFKIEGSLSKQEIMELYLNSIYFGKGAYGVSAAAWRYYGKSLVELNLAEIAMIAGLPQAPSARNPISNMPAALNRRNFVLQKLYQHNFIDKKKYRVSLNLPDNSKLHNWPKDKVLASLITQDGQKVHTSIVYELQSNFSNSCNKFHGKRFWLYSKDYIAIIENGAIIAISKNNKQLQPAPSPCKISIKQDYLVLASHILERVPYIILGTK